MDNITPPLSFDTSANNNDWDIDMVRGLATLALPVKVYVDDNQFEWIDVDLVCHVKFIDHGTTSPCRLGWAPSWQHDCLSDLVMSSVLHASGPPAAVLERTRYLDDLVRWIKDRVQLPSKPSMDSIRSSLMIVAEDAEGRYVLEAGTALGASWIVLSDRTSSNSSFLCVWPFPSQRDIADAAAEFLRVSTTSLHQAIISAIESSTDQDFAMPDYITSKEMA